MRSLGTDLDEEVLTNGLPDAKRSLVFMYFKFKIRSAKINGLLFSNPSTRLPYEEYLFMRI